MAGLRASSSAAPLVAAARVAAGVTVSDVPITEIPRLSSDRADRLLHDHASQGGQVSLCLVPGR